MADASTKDYKSTLNLPTTEFPMKANLAQREPEFLKYWEGIRVYQRLRELDKNRAQKFIVLDGPPYANGNIHIGHALDKILKDMVVKSKSFSGFAAPFVPGWDCHGLPIELNVEKKHGKAGVEISPEEFRQACRNYAKSQIDIQREEFKRLGVLGDWEHPFLTMDFRTEADIIRVLAKVVANGHLVQGFKPVHWCIDCGSALAEAEVEYANKISPAIDVRFKVVDEAEFLKRLPGIKNKGHGPISIPIWTTTPWTLPANEAVALHPESEYTLVQVDSPQGQERLVLASVLLQSSLQRYGVTDYQELSRFPGQVLERILLQHPFYERQVPVVLGEHVTMDAGTGAVHTAPAHGQEDYAIGVQYKLPLLNPVAKNGCYLSDTPLFGGEHIFKANTHIISVLEEKGNLLVKEQIEHSYPHCWRHKTPLIFLATPQWFIAIQHSPLQNCAAIAASHARWLPEWGYSSIVNMIVSRPDWCISRQRTWGTPIPLFVHKKTRQLHPNTVALMEQVAERVERESIEAWFSTSTEGWLGEEGKDYDKVTDILDVWFDAGTMHYDVVRQHPELNYPADLYSEGTDQYRGWFQSSLLTAVAMQVNAHDKEQSCDKVVAPFRTVITHGFTVDEKGRKMSKSLGNVIAPDKVINNLGADILRLWVASTDYRGEIAVSDEILKRTAEAYRRIRNTARYLLSNLYDFDPQKNLVDPEKMLSLDRWAVERANLLQQEIQQAYDEYQFHVIYQKLQNFCITDLGGFYLDVTKDRQYTMQKNSLGRRSAQTAMFHIIAAMVRWLAPILSFTAEEIWRYLPGKHQESVFLETWYEDLKTTNAGDPLAVFERQPYWELIRQVREAVNKEIEKLRDEGEIGSALEAEVEIYCEPKSKLMLALSALQNELRFVLITSMAKVLPVTQHTSDNMMTINGENVWIKVTASTYAKCVRCWHRRADVGSNPEDPELCARCVENVSGTGEIRVFA